MALGFLAWMVLQLAFAADEMVHAVVELAAVGYGKGLLFAVAGVETGLVHTRHVAVVASQGRFVA